MNQAIFHRTLVELNDELAELSSVRLIKLEPHRHANDSFVASVAVRDEAGDGMLRCLAERVYQHTGALVMFRKERLQEVPGI